MKPTLYFKRALIVVYWAFGIYHTKASRNSNEYRLDRKKMCSTYTIKAQFIRNNKTCILLVTLLILCKLTNLSYIGCNAFQSHLIYWDPDNIIFQTKPVTLLRVKPKDEIIFVCAQESLYILWTYEHQVFETCSMWLNDNLMVNLLLRCPNKVNRKLQMRQSINDSAKDQLNFMHSHNSFIKDDVILHENNSYVKNDTMNRFTERSTKVYSKRLRSQHNH
ncbi:hypothetical protein MN116_006713 [Schistosoma mekongi]|uniref:Uncharacterized protein n=1 Tax=Schistosoma mekongi TaxID=38744 RepID=A0AAE1Z989_SCHME|nr:hypothetical protein MN116_006713 [Schistosoma mekongi]